MTKPHGTKRMTAIVLRGSVIVSFALTSLLIIHGFFSGNILGERVLFGFIIILYLVIGELLIRKQHYVLVGWMIMVLSILISFTTLLLWGLNAPVGILTVGFIIFLSGVMLGPKHIIWVAGSVTLLLCSVQYIHQLGHIKPELQALAKPSDNFDVLAYITILGVFALLSWLSGKQTEHSLNRAKSAEEKLRSEKDNLVIRLEEQSRELHQVQLQEMLRLYKFAEIGQSTTATLHELSNLLSVLTLDIDDIRQRHQRSEAITNAEEGINHINHLVRETRRKLHDNRNTEVFNIIPIIEEVIKELQPKFKLKNVELRRKISGRKSFKILGDAPNLAHVITILLNNAFDACVLEANAKVSVTILQQQNTLSVSVLDNGPGIPEVKRRYLFSPHQSAKPSGLGIGLYITKHIIESQFHGKIQLTASKTGACFTIELPRHVEDGKASNNVRTS